MTTNERRRRPMPERTHPERGWRTLLDGNVRAPEAHASGDGEPGARGATQASRVTDAVSRSVELGYRVIDDYLQQGQRVARRLSDGRPAPEVWATEIQDLGVRMARYASDFLAAWMELLELTARGGASAARPARPGDGSAVPAPSEAAAPERGPGPGAAPERAADRRVRIAVRSARPVDVEVDYRPERVTGPRVRVHALRALEPGTPRIDTVTFTPGAGSESPVLVVRVPDAQPAGSYEGLLVDEGSNRPVGSVRVDVAADDVARR